MPHKIEIEFQDPVTIGFGPTPGNELRTLPYIPATTLRGAIYEGLRAEGLSSQADAWLGPEGPRWSAAWPQYCLPMPRCFYRVKGDAGFQTKLGIWNMLSDAEPPQTAERFRALTAGDSEDAEPPTTFAWTASSAAFFNFKAGTGHSPARQVDMHAGLYYGQQTVRGSSLFSREALQPARYWALVSRLPNGSQLVDSLTLGKRKSVTGGAALQWGASWDAPAATLAAPSGHQAVVQLLTDAIVPGDTGAFLRGIDSHAWSSLLDIGVATSKAWSAAGLAVGWSGAWGLPREQAVVIRAGSVWRLSSPDSHLVAALNRLQEDGIGIRRHEGFGWLLVNPPWLVNSLEKLAFRSALPLDERPASLANFAWPGFGIERMASLRNWARDANPPKDWDGEHLRCLHHLIATVQQRQSVDAALDLLRSRAATGRKAWLDANQRLQAPLEKARDDANLALFYLEALRTNLEAREFSR